MKVDLRQTVICVSGLDEQQRGKVERVIEREGGTFTGSLTTDVTHLISNTTQSEKYKVAVRLGIPVVSSEWLGCLQDDQYLQPLEDYPLLPFTGAVICLSGFTFTLRREIEQRVVALGGVFSAALTTDVTHLVVDEPSGPKFEEAVKMNIHVVGIEWLNACCSAKGRITESHFSQSAVQFKEKRQTTSSQYLDRCNIFFGEGFDSTVLQFIKKVIRDGGGNMPKKFDGFITHFVVAGSVLLESDKQLLQSYPNENVHVITYKWLSECYRRHELVKIDPYLVDTHSENKTVPAKKSSGSGNVFHLKSFRIRGFPEKESNSMRRHIIRNGGQILDSSRVDYSITPFNSSESPFLDKLTVTEFWLESCITHQTIADIKSNVLFSPTQVPLPITALTGLYVGISGYEGLERTQFCQAIQLSGATYVDQFSRGSDILVYNPNLGQQSPKFDKAIEWNIPVVRGEWVYACLEKGAMVDLDEYIFTSKTDPTRHSPDTTALEMDSEALIDLVRKKNGCDERDELQDEFEKALFAANHKYESKPAEPIEDFNNTDGYHDKDNVGHGLKRKATDSDASTARNDNSPTKILMQENPDSLIRKQRIAKKRPFRNFVASSQIPVVGTTQLIVENGGLRAKDPEFESIRYKDPAGQLEKSRLIEKLGRGTKKNPIEHSQQALSCSGNPSRDICENVPKNGNSLSCKSKAEVVKPYNFLFSGLPAGTRKQCMDVIKKLGGNVLRGDTWNTECTHVIVSSLGRSEKMLAACASGTWVLKVSYINECGKKGMFVAEEAHEWGYESDDPNAIAVKKWRQRIQSGEITGCFAGWKVLLVVEESKKKGFVQVLVAGGAKVTEGNKTLVGINPGDFTQALIDATTRSILGRLKSFGIPVYETQGLVRYLMGDELVEA